MTELEKAARMALSTLEGWGNHGKWVWPETALEQAKRNTTESITALRRALEQPVPAQKPVGFDEWWHNEGSQAPKPTDDMYEHCKRMCEIAWANGAYKALEQPAQEPLAWMPIEQMYPQAKAIDILMGDGSILCAVLPQFDGDLWWEGSGTGEKFIDPKYANVTHWRIHGETRPQAREQPAQQEPVAWMVMNGVCNYQLFWSKHQADALCAEMQKRHDLSGSLASFHVQPLYTRPQAREWVGLTDEEIEQCMKQAYATVQGRNLEHAFARAIEQAHGITGEKK